jgi:hypothetical protein
MLGGRQADARQLVSVDEPSIIEVVEIMAQPKALGW